jgi:hypothetical protein
MTTDLDLCGPCPTPAGDTGRHANDAIVCSRLRQGSV